MSGHRGAVNCLLYPHEEHARYERHQLLSGGIDFCVFLWDLNSGSRIYRFCVQAGPILRLIVPPDNCNVETFAYCPSLAELILFVFCYEKWYTFGFPFRLAENSPVYLQCGRGSFGSVAGTERKQMHSVGQPPPISGQGDLLATSGRLSFGAMRRYDCLRLANGDR